MTDDTPKTPDAKRRVCDRLSLSIKILLELDNGEILIGQTVNISPRGALMQTDTSIEGELLGLEGTLFIISYAGQFSIGHPCKVARQDDSAIAAEIDKKAAAAFGNHMTKDLLGCWQADCHLNQKKMPSCGRSGCHEWASV